MANTSNPFSGFSSQARGQRLFQRRSRQSLPLGPWPQGVYNNGPLEDVPSGFCSDILNLDILPTGVLTARRGFRDIDCGGGRTAPVVTVLGTCWEGNEQYLLLQRTSSGPLTELLSVKTGAPTAYSTTFNDSRSYSAAVKYGSTVYFICSSGASKTVTATTAAGGTALTASVNIPQGDDAFIVKDRMFVVNKSTNRVYYSKATDPTIWTTPDGGFFDVDPGDGQNITGFIFNGTAIYIFKNGATYLFTFTSDPGVDGYLRKIADIGADDVVFFEGALYIVNKTGLYRIVNTSYELLSQQVNLALIPNVRIWRIRELLIINNSSLGFSYVFNTRTKSWSKYDSSVSDTSRINKMSGESFEKTFGQRLTWVTRGSSGVLATFNTNVPANAGGDNRDYHLGDASSLGIAPTYKVQTGLIAPQNGMRLVKLVGSVIDITAKHAHNARFALTLYMANNSNNVSSVNLVADVPNHGDAVHDGNSWSGTSRAYNATPDSPVAYRSWATSILLQYTGNTEDSSFNFEVRNIFAVISTSAREVDTTATLNNA